MTGEAEGARARKLSELTEAEFISNIAAAFFLGLLLSWLFFGSPLLLANEFQIGSLGEWLAAIGTFIVGFGAWKYARATHFHTLDRADEERIERLDQVRDEIAALRTLIVRSNEPRAAVKTLDANPHFQSGVYRMLMCDVRDAVSATSWPDARVLAYSNEASLQYQKMQNAATAFIRMTRVVVSYYEEDSEASLNELQQTLYARFKDSALELAKQADVFSTLISEKLKELSEAREEIEVRRQGRSRVFDFHP